MMLAKLIATLATSMAPAARRSTVISALALRRRMSRTGVLVLGDDRAHHLQHVVHRRLILGGVVGDRAEQRFHLREIVGRQRLYGAAGRGPFLLQLLGELGFPWLRLGLHRGAGVEHDLLQ